MKGTVKFFNTMKAFGFVAGDDGTEYFVHQTGLQDGVTLKEGDVVSFDVEQGDRGPKAVNVGKGGEEAAPAEDNAEEESAEESEDVEETSEDESEDAEEDSDDAEEASEDDSEDEEKKE